MAGRSRRGGSSVSRPRAARWLIAAGMLALGGALTVAADAATPPAYAATASIKPKLYYIGDTVSSGYTFTVKNTGTTSKIGAVEITRPSGWGNVTSCPSGPTGWVRTASTTKCRYRSAASTSDDIVPGASKTFVLNAKTAPGTQNRTGTWLVLVSKSNHFDTPSLLKYATPTGAGLTTRAYLFELTTAVVGTLPATPGTACPAANKEAIVGSTKTIVICGKNRATQAYKPILSYSSLGGTFIADPGTFTSATIVKNSANVVLANWVGTEITSVFGTGKKVIASVGASPGRTSPLRTFTGYSATSQPPDANDDAYSTDEDTQLVKNAGAGVLANDTDAESDPLTAALVDDVDNGTLALAADGSFTYDPDPDFSGTDTFTYKANDTHSDSPAATVTITVNPVNDAPVATDDAPSISENSTGSVVDVLANDTDADPSDTLTVSAVDTTGTTGSVTNNGTNVTYDPNGQFEYLRPGETATDTFTYTVTDGTATDTAAVTVTVTGVNDAPDAVDDGATTDEATGTGPISVLTNDTDDEGAVTLTSVDTTGTAGTVTNNGDGTLSYSPNGAFENLEDGEDDTDTFTYTITDLDGATDTATVTITVNGINDAPTAVDDAPSIGENSTGSVVNVLGNDTDPESQTLAVTAVDTTGTTGSVTNNGTDVTYDPNGMFEYLGADETATDVFTYTVTDSQGATDTATVTVTVTGVNDAPNAVDDTASTTEAAATGPISVLANDTDAEGAVTITGVDTTGTDGAVTNNNDGTLTYDPNGAFEDLGNGEDDTDTFTYTITDAQGGTDTATVTITVNGINDAPAGNDDAANVGEDSTGSTVSVLANDTDAESQTLTVTAVDTTGTTGTVTNNGTDVTYDPNGMFEYLGDGQTAQDTFTYTVTDSQGGTDTATVTITVVGDNDDPVAVDDTGSTTEAAATGPISVLTNDTDAEGAVTITAVGATTDGGTVTNNNDGTLTYNPNGAFESLGNGQSDTDTFTYTITDAQGATDTATVTITVNGINDAPVATDDAPSVGEDSTGSTVSVLGNDTDAESQTLTVTAVDTTGTTGSVTNNGTDVTYDPNGMFEYLDTGETATDTFTYTVTDSQGATDTATVTVTVTGVEDAPTAVDDAYIAVQDTPLVVSLPGVLANDTDADDTLTAGNASTPANGDVTLNADGSFTYTPDSGYVGPDSFTYDASDGTSTDSATVSITVKLPNDAPTVEATGGTGLEDGGAITVTLTGEDADGDALTFTAGTATDGLVSVPGTPTCDGNTPNTCTVDVTYTPNANFNGSDSFTYTANDGTEDSASGVASLTVTPVNDQPSFTKGADQTVNEDAGAQTVTGWATAISPGPANESAQAVSFGASTDNDALFSALPEVSSTGDLTYTPAPDASGVATVTVQATDDGGVADGGNNQSPTQQFTITVTAVNDVPSFTKGADQVVFEDAGAQSVSGWATAISKGPADESAQTLTFNVTNDNGALFTTPGQPAISPTGTLTYTSAPNAVGSATVSVSLSDNGGTANGGDDTSDVQTFTITVNGVNDEPSLTHDGDQTVLEDAGAQTVSGFVNTTSAGPSDESSQVVTVSVTGQTNGALFSAFPAIDSAGTLTYTPAVDANGTSTVTVHATDNGGTANGGDDTGPDMTFVITVTAVNDEPSFVKGANQTLDEDSGAQSVSGWATSISKGPANESGQTLTFNVTNDNNALFSGQPAVSPTGTLTYTSAPNQYGSATVSIFLSDDGGTANGGDDTSPTQTFTITVNPVNDAPVAAAKAFTVQANMKISLGGLLVGATDPNDSPVPAGQPAYTPSFTVGTITPGASCIGCTVSNVNNANGTFDFDPPAGGTGTFSVTYTVVDSGYPAPGATSAPQTITFTVNGPVVWFVDEDAATNGTGRLSAPFDNLASATSAMGTNTNQRIHVEDGNSTGNVVLQTNSWLISDTITQNNFDTVMGITPPAGTIARPSNAGAPQRTLTGSVTLGDNSVARGFNLTPVAGTAGLIGSGADGVTVDTMSISTTTARAVDLLNSSGTFSLTSVSASGANRGISLENVNVSSGSFAINGTGTAGTGGTIAASTALGTLADPEGGIFLKNTKNVTLKWMNVSANLANGIYGEDVTTLVLEDSTFPNNGTDENLDHDGMHWANLLGTSSITRVDVSGSREDSTKVMNTSGTANLTVANSTFRTNHATLGANGLYIDTKNSAVMTFTSTSNTFTSNNTSGLAIFSQGTQKMTATVTGGTYTTNGVGLDIETNGTGGMQFTVTGGTVTGCVSCGVPVNMYKGSGATGTGSNATAGTITGMTISNGESQLATGIWIHGEGGGAARVAITNNNISAIAQRGIDVTFGQALGGTQVVDATISGNTFVQNNAASLSSVNVDAGTVTGDNTTICADIKTNTITNPNANDIRVVNSYATTVVKLPGYAGAATDTAAVQSYLIARNTASDASAVNNSGAPGFSNGGAACAAP